MINSKNKIHRLVLFKTSLWFVSFTLLNTQFALAQTTPRQLAKETFVSRANSFSLSDNFKALRLKVVLEQGMRQNYNENIRSFQKEILKLNWKDTKEAFWMPNLKLTLDTSPHRIFHLRNGSENRVTGTSQRPTGALSLDFGEYTVFNWGKDYLNYLSNKSTYLRDLENLDEERQELKHDLILNFFKLVSYKKIEKIRRSQLRHASFIYRLAKEKVSLKKLSKQDYYLSRTEYLKAQTDYHEAKIEISLQEDILGEMINDPLGTKYILNEQIDYQKIGVTLSESVDLAKKYNRKIKDSTVAIKNAQRDYDLKNRENLPLPKLTMDLGAYTHPFGKNSGGMSYGNSSNKNLEIVATINASWSLTGKGGLLNSRDVKRSQLKKIIAFKSKAKYHRSALAKINSHYKNLLYFQDQITILEARVPTLQKSFDTILENYTSRKTNFLNYHHALNDLSEAQILVETFIYKHLAEKVSLATTIGIEDFPGANFESLAKKIKEVKL